MDGDREYYCFRDSDECESCPLSDTIYCSLMNQKLVSFSQEGHSVMIDSEGKLFSLDRINIDPKFKAFVSYPKSYTSIQ